MVAQEPVKALDTNILVRIVTGDSPDQMAVAESVLAQPCFISLTVLQELVWVLQSRFGFTRDQVRRSIEGLRATRNVTIARADGLDWVLERYIAKADFADMVHILDAEACSAFLTFDRAIVGHAGTNPPVSVETLRI